MQANKYSFTRVEGKAIEPCDRQWILRIYYILRGKDLFVEADDLDLVKLIAETSCCSISTIKEILEIGEISLTDQRGHSMRKDSSDTNEPNTGRNYHESKGVSLRRSNHLHNKYKGVAT